MIHGNSLSTTIALGGYCGERILYLSEEVGVESAHVLPIEVKDWNLLVAPLACHKVIRFRCLGYVDLLIGDVFSLSVSLCGCALNTPRLRENGQCGDFNFRHILATSYVFLKISSWLLFGRGNPVKLYKRVYLSVAYLGAF